MYFQASPIFHLAQDVRMAGSLDRQARIQFGKLAGLPEKTNSLENLMNLSKKLDSV